MTIFSWLWPSFDPALFTTNDAIILSAISAGVFSIVAIRKNRANVRDSETITMLHNIIWNADYIEARDVFVKARDEGAEKCVNRPSSAKFKAINKMMNHYEVLAIGIKRGILSEPVLKDFTKKRLVKDWQETKAFIEALRRKNNKNNAIFREFEELAKKWQKEGN